MRAVSATRALSLVVGLEEVALTVRTSWRNPFGALDKLGTRYPGNAP
ncbi:hypothetical protein [uncultured Friedmanniella sp.]